MGIRPKTREGYVYYVRLRTNKGVFYKIGFTTMESLEKRFSYKGSENYKLIDKIFLYKYFIYAYDIEQLLHDHLRNENAYSKYKLANLFRDLSAHPLFRDGQTELYKEDVLGLDPDYQRPFSLFNLFSAPRHNLVRNRTLSMDGYHQSVKDQAEKRVYQILDDFLKAPLFESKNDYIYRRKEWVVSINRWAVGNALGVSLRSGVDDGKTIHGGKPLPVTETDLIRMKEFSPVWAYTDSIPDEIKFLKNLEVVSFPFDTIKIIPRGLYQLSKLKKLDISYSSVSVISDEIQKLSSLESLNISNCDNIHKLPLVLETLPNLKEIIVSKSSQGALKKYLPTKSYLLKINEWEQMIGQGS